MWADEVIKSQGASIKGSSGNWQETEKKANEEKNLPGPYFLGHSALLTLMLHPAEAQPSMKVPRMGLPRIVFYASCQESALRRGISAGARVSWIRRGKNHYH